MTKDKGKDRRGDLGGATTNGTTTTTRDRETTPGHHHPRVGTTHALGNRAAGDRTIETRAKVEEKERTKERNPSGARSARRRTTTQGIATTTKETSPWRWT